jgi:uncharacterized protein (TIGR02001 family)
VIAAAHLRASQARGYALRGLVFAACFWTATPAAAQVGASLSIFSDSQFRGYSLSAGRPVAIADLSYDDPGGLYAAFSGSLVLGAEDSIRPLGLQLNGGYARRLPSGPTIDFGVIHSEYSRYSSAESANSYTEVYAGVTHKFLTARAAFSPHYFVAGSQTFYGEIDANFSAGRKLHFSGHLGLLVPISSGEGFEESRTQHDWRLGARREFGRASLHLFATGGGPGRDYYRDREHNRTAVTLGLSYAL